MCWLSDLFKSKKTVDVPSPGGIIAKGDIVYLETTAQLVVQLKPPVWVTSVANTKSMDPLIDAGDIAILSKDFKHEKLIPGDIVAYTVYDTTILHRILKIDETTDGERLYTCQGDNNAYPDPYVISDEAIRWYFVGVFYCKK